MYDTILVAVSVKGGTRAEMMNSLAEGLREMGQPGDDNAFGVECWWFAEDDRTDGSDNDSAVFCNPGAQEQAAKLLHAGVASDPHNGQLHQPLVPMTSECNIVKREVRAQFDGSPT